ncbi:unnamed protein product [Dicrocoelium dendriticum]|nr:unnamed protein product [Dicrocoelium dendriticum]
MSKQKEDVLLMVKHVRYKKVDGTLYVNSGRIAWRNQTSDSFKISAAFEDVRVQRISPDQKEKVQLQLLMHSGESFTFHFADPGGRGKQLEMRNSVKEMLQSLLPKFKDKAHSELKEKFRLLESNPEILALYKELVVTGILTSEEFWARPQFSKAAPYGGVDTVTTSFTPQQKSSSRAPVSIADHSPSSALSSSATAANITGQISRSFQLEDKPQQIGVPSCLLSDIKPETDGANGIKYNLTHDTIDAIFRAYPTVRQRHRELVPDKLSEADFWIKFFQSHYFHRDRIQLPKEDIFAECAQLDERYLQNELRRSRRYRITAQMDFDNLTDHDIGPGYSMDIDDIPVSSPLTESNKLPSTATNPKTAHLSANQILMRRFNNHSILVLKSLGSDTSTAPPVDATDSSSRLQVPVGDSSSSTHQSIKERIYGPELTKDPEPEYIPLDIVNVNDYMDGPSTSDPGAISSISSSNAPSRSRPQAYSNTQLEAAVQRCKTAMHAAYESNRKPPKPFMGPLDAQIALADVSSGGCLVGGKGADDHKAGRTDLLDGTDTSGCRGPIDQTCPLRSSSTTSIANRESTEEVDRSPALLNSEQLRELNLLYASASELLRHFWACFPVTNPQLTEKLERMAASLTRFRSTKLAHFAATCDQSLCGKGDVCLSTSGTSSSTNRNAVGPTLPYRSRVTGHLECMFDAAQQKYAEWRTKRKR